MRSDILRVSTAEKCSSRTGEIIGTVIDQGIMLYDVHGVISLQHIEAIVALENDLLVDLTRTFGGWQEIIFLHDISYIEPAAFGFLKDYLQYLKNLKIHQASTAIVSADQESVTNSYRHELLCLYRSNFSTVQSFHSSKDAIFWSQSLGAFR